VLAGVAGVAGDRMVRLRARSRPRAVVLAVCFLGAGVIGVLASGGSSRAVSLRVGGHPPPVAVESPNDTASSVVPTTPGGAGGASAQGAAATASAPDGPGVGGAPPAAVP